MATTAPATKKSNKGRKSAAIALAVVGVAGLSLASAAQLNINNSLLGAGTSVVDSCQPTGATSQPITVTFTNSYLAGSGYTTSAVVLNGIAPTCLSLNYRVEVTGTNGVALGEVVDKIPATGTTATATLTTAVSAKEILGVSVVIYS